MWRTSHCCCHVPWRQLQKQQPQQQQERDCREVSLAASAQCELWLDEEAARPLLLGDCTPGLWWRHPLRGDRRPWQPSAAAACDALQTSATNAQLIFTPLYQHLWVILGWERKSVKYYVSLSCTCTFTWFIFSLKARNKEKPPIIGIRFQKPGFGSPPKYTDSSRAEWQRVWTDRHWEENNFFFSE